jgi:hypothetical protein
MTFDNFFKELMQDIFRDLKIQSEVSVGSLPLKIDLIINCPILPPKTKILPILTNRFSNINIIEYKSSHDTP